MNRVWTCMLLTSLLYAVFTGRGGEAASALLTSGDDAVRLLLTLLATMTLWSGLMGILEASGDVQRLGRVFRKLAKPLFPGLSDEGCWSAMCMNLSANLLGLGNAATPAGIDAAKRMQEQGETGLRALAMLLVIDNASLQLMPTTVITLRQAAGSADPAGIWLPTIVVSLMAMVAGIGMMALIQRGGMIFGRMERNSCHRDRRADCAAGHVVGE